MKNKFLFILVLFFSFFAFGQKIEVKNKITIISLPYFCTSAEIEDLIQKNFGFFARTATAQEFFDISLSFKVSIESDVYCLGTRARTSDGKEVVARWDKSSFDDLVNNQMGSERFQWIIEDHLYSKGTLVAVSYPNIVTF